MKIIPEYLTRTPVVQSRPKAGGPPQGVCGGLHPVVDPDLDEVGVGDVSDHVIPVVSVVPRPVVLPSWSQCLNESKGYDSFW